MGAFTAVANDRHGLMGLCILVNGIVYENRAVKDIPVVAQREDYERGNMKVSA